MKYVVTFKKEVEADNPWEAVEKAQEYCDADCCTWFNSVDEVIIEEIE